MSFETYVRSAVKTVTYRAGSIATVTPATALWVQYWATGKLDTHLIATFIAATAAANLIFNSAYYFLYERVAARFRRGYKVKALDEAVAAEGVSADP